MDLLDETQGDAAVKERREATSECVLVLRKSVTFTWSMNEPPQSRNCELQGWKVESPPNSIRNLCILRIGVITTEIRARLQEILQAEWRVFRNGEEWVGAAYQYGLIRSMLPKNEADHIHDTKDIFSGGLKHKILPQLEGKLLGRVVEVIASKLSSTCSLNFNLAALYSIYDIFSVFIATMMKMLEKAELTPEMFEKAFKTPMRPQLAGIGISETRIDELFNQTNFAPDMNADLDKEEAQRLKSEGVELFRKREWQLSVDKFALALKLNDVDGKEGSNSLSADLRAVLWSNIAAAELEMKHFDRTLRAADDALCLFPGWWKPNLWLARAANGLKFYPLAPPFAVAASSSCPYAWRAACASEVEFARAAIENKKGNGGNPLDDTSAAMNESEAVRLFGVEGDAVDVYLEEKSATSSIALEILSARRAFREARASLCRKKEELTYDDFSEAAQTFVFVCNMMPWRIVALEEMKDCALTVLRTHGGNFQALVLTAFCAQRRGACTQLLKNFLPSFPNDPMILSIGARSHAVLGQYDKALQLIEVAQEKLSKDSKIPKSYKFPLHLQMLTAIYTWERAANTMDITNYHVSSEDLMAMHNLVKIAPIDHPIVPRCHFDLAHLHLLEGQIDLSKQLYITGYEMLQHQLKIDDEPYTCDSKKILDVRWYSELRPQIENAVTGMASSS